MDSDIHNIFRPGTISPVALIDEYITLVPDQPSLPRLDFVVRKIEQFMTNISLPSVNANSTSSQTEIDSLYVDELELLQARFIPSPYSTQVALSMAQPSTSPKGALKKLGTQIPFNITDFDPCLHLTQFFVYGQNTVYFTIYNTSSSSITPSFQFFGLKYKLEKTSAPPVSTKIPIYPLITR
ncbi:MAG: hypothetical protein JTT12_05550 [Candidatus Brockarchaeota archaeon]|nr:hypothetical protein [Candidatus Brockarchaeota archaeon]